jgi:hypothetical protein
MHNKQTLPYASQRLVAYLATCSEPRDLITITANAGISYSAASVHTRTLVSQGLLERVCGGKVVAFRLVQTEVS